MQQSKFTMVQSFQNKAYEMFMNDHQFYIRTTSKQFALFNAIKINRLTCKIIQYNDETLFNDEIISSNAKIKQSIDLIIGIININQEPYLIIVNQIDSPAILENDRIYQIKDTKFIPFKHKFLYNSIDQGQNQKIIAFIKEVILKDNFYFCYKLDLTLTRTKFYDKQNTQSKYFWNQSLLQYFRQSTLAACWRIPIIQGHVRQIYCQNQFFTFYYAIISRRSKQMSGTRFNHRGINQKYQAANFVQTQQIFICHNYLFSHASLRGSVPLYWKQQNVKADIIFKHKIQEDHQKGIQLHYRNLQSDYKGKICTINLLSKIKSPQSNLKIKYQHFYYKVIKDNSYLHFDLNEQMKDQNGQKAIDLFINSSKGLFSTDQNFFVMDRYTKKVINVQKIYPRINCLDCIDRTNVIMARISQCYLSQIQEFINHRVKVKQKILTLEKDFKKNLIKLWVQLGNRISMLYCGTQSVANHITKKQNNSLLSFLSGSIKSINRFYNANIGDNFKHQCIQYLLSRKGILSQTFYFGDNISRKILLLNQLKFCQYQQVKMYIVTWNCSQVDPYKLLIKEKIKIFNFLNQDVDIVVFNLQEIVQLNSYNVILGNNENILTDWTKIILQSLNNVQINKNLQNNKQKQFSLITKHDLVGIATFLFATNKLINRINKYNWLDVKTGLKGNSGHKGAIILYIQVDSSWITFINCHLASGQNKKSERIQDIEFIHNQAMSDRTHRRLFDISEFKFFVGDMNFSLDLKNQIVKQTLYNIEKKDTEQKLTKSQMEQLLKPLLEKDQRYQASKLGCLSSYEQAEILFLPTYKFEVKTKSYDLKKTPSWYDRILYQVIENNRMAVIKYNDINVYLSDHKPVYAIFNLLIRKENEERKKKYVQNYLYNPQNIKLKGSRLIV